MKIKEIDQIFNRFDKMQVVVIGDSMIDSYLWGKVDRVSPEAPVPVVSVTKKESRLGGAGNVSLNIKALGATPYLFSVVGSDDKGKEFKELLKSEEMPYEGIFEDTGRITTVKSRIISKGQHIARVDEENIGFINFEIETEIINGVKKLLGERKIDVIVFVDYDKGVITPNLFNQINEMATRLGIPTAVDPKKRNFNQYHNISLFKPNFQELVDGIGVPIVKGDFETIKKEADKIGKDRNFKMILVTLSELGILIGNGVEGQYYPAIIRDIADVSGAGDTVIGVASLAMAAGLDQKTIALFSNLAGGLVCEKVGVVPVNREQLKKELGLQKFE